MLLTSYYEYPMSEQTLIIIMIYIQKKDFIILPAFYLIICLALYMSQRSLMYFPDVSEVYNKEVWTPIVQKNEVLALESKDNNKKTIILFHGNATNATSQVFYRKFFRKNIHLIAVEYPGYGLNNKKNISKDNLLDHARKVMKYAKEKYGDNIILTGESLGTGIASEMAKEFQVKKLLLITPYTSISDVAQDKFWFVPASLLIKDNFNNINTLENYKGETFILMSEYDNVVPHKFAQRLHNSLNNKKEQIFIKGAGHSNWNDYITDSQLNQLRKFLDL